MNLGQIKLYFKKGLLIVLVPAIVLYLFGAIFRAVDGLWYLAVYKIFHFKIWTGVGFAFTLFLILLFGWLASIEKIKKAKIVQFVKSLPQKLFFSRTDFLQNGNKVRSAIVKLGEIRLFVFVTGQVMLGPHKYYKVFSPTIPAAVTGYVFIVPENQIEILANSPIEIVRQIMSYGIVEINLKILEKKWDEKNV